MTKDEALKLALEALERCVATCFDPYAHEQVMSWPEHFVNQTITAIKEALAQPEQDGQCKYCTDGCPACDARKLPEQEPVGKFAKFTDGIWREVTDGSAGAPLYTSPPQRTWVWLTDDDKEEIKRQASYHWEMTVGEYADEVQRFTISKLKEKNT